MVDNVKVCVRCRPLSAQEIHQGFQSAVQVDKIGKTVSVKNGTSPNVSLPIQIYYYLTRYKE